MTMNLKRYIPIAITVVALCLPISCNKSDPESTRDVEIKFDTGTADKNLDMEVLKELVRDKTVKNIYLTAISPGGWSGCVARNITQMRERFFQPRMELSPKTHGRGDFNFKWGEASKVPEDSLWYVQQGWTINKNSQPLFCINCGKSAPPQSKYCPYCGEPL